MICIKPLSVTALALALTLSLSACGKGVAVTLKGSDVETSPVTVDPSATPNPSATPIVDPTPTSPAWLKMKLQPKADVSPAGTLSLDMRNWLAMGYIASSDPAVTITRVEDTNIASYQRVLDTSGNWVRMKAIRLRSFEPGAWIRLPIWIRNAGGAELRASLEISVVKPYLRFSRNFGFFKVPKKAGKIEFNVVDLYNRGDIKSSTDQISMDAFKTNLPISNCLDLLSEAGTIIGIRCNKGELTEHADSYSVWMHISTTEGENDEHAFGVIADGK